MKRIISTFLISTAIIGGGLSATSQEMPSAPVNVTADATQFDFELKGYVFGIRMIKSSFAGSFTDTQYEVRSDLKTSGLGALLKKLRIWAITTGRLDASGLHPESHTQQNLDKKNRRVEMRYDYGRQEVSVDINPPIGSQGVPPASPEERFTADDTLSAVLSLMLKGYKLDGEVCIGGVRVFDSKQHYNLRMERVGYTDYKKGGFNEQVLKCHVFYEPISGFDPEDLPDTEEGGTPVVVYFADRPDLGMHIPLRFTYKISGFKAVIKVVDMTVIPPA